MTLEEAESRIKDLEAELSEKEKEIAEFEKNAGNVLSDEDIKKMQQKFDNQGYDRGKKQFEETLKNYVPKEEVEKKERELQRTYEIKTTLLKMGSKNPDMALKVIADEDLEDFGTDTFNADAIKEKYSEVLVFGDKGSNTPPPPRTRDNRVPDNKITAKNYDKLPESEKSKLSPEEKLALLKEE